MRIAHVISTVRLFAGAENVLAGIVRAAAARGHEQLVLNPFAQDPEGDAAPSFYAPAAYRAHGLESAWALNSLRRWVRSQLVTFNPDVVHVHLFHASAIVASLRHHWPTILTHHHGGVFKAKPFYRAADAIIGLRYGTIVAVSNAGLSLLAQRYRGRGPRTELIQNGWTGQPLPWRPPRTGSIVSIGNLRREKGHDTLINAMPAVLASIPRATVSLVGEGDERLYLEDLAESLGVSGAVRFEGRSSNVWSYLACADVHVLPSRSEVFGIAGVEALAAGTPLVASDVGGIPDYATHEETALLVPSDTPKELAEAIVRVIEDRKLAERLSVAGIARAAEFRLERKCEDYLALYRSTVE